MMMMMMMTTMEAVAEDNMKPRRRSRSLYASLTPITDWSRETHPLQQPYSAVEISV